MSSMCLWITKVEILINCCKIACWITVTNRLLRSFCSWINVRLSFVFILVWIIVLKKYVICIIYCTWILLFLILVNSVITIFWYISIIYECFMTSFHAFGSNNHLIIDDIICMEMIDYLDLGCLLGWLLGNFVPLIGRLLMMYIAWHRLLLMVEIMAIIIKRLISWNSWMAIIWIELLLTMIILILFHGTHHITILPLVIKSGWLCQPLISIIDEHLFHRTLWFIIIICEWTWNCLIVIVSSVFSITWGVISSDKSLSLVSWVVVINGFVCKVGLSFLLFFITIILKRLIKRLIIALKA
jgi:hypothetical protein